MLTATQSIVARDNHRFRVLLCGRRWGKSTLAAKEIKAMAIQTEARIAYIAPTYQQARDIAWEILKKELGEAIVNINEARLEIRVVNQKKTESIIFLRGWESIETLRGQAFDFLILDEVAMMRGFWMIWQEVLRPTLTDRKGIGMFIGTPRGFNHLYDLYNLESKDSDFKSFHFTSYDNPHLDVEELNKAKRELTEDRFAQEYLADFRKTEGLVYKEFNRLNHLFTDFPKESSFTRLLGIDFGFTNPCAVLEVKKDRNNHYWVMSEWYKRGKTDDEIGEYVAQLKAEKVYADPEAPDKIETLKRKGVYCREVIKGKGSIEAGINKVRNLFKQQRLHIHKECLNLIYELETYTYPDRRPGNNEPEQPIKENDHSLDALRYIIMMDDREDVRPIMPIDFKPKINPAR